MKHIALRGATLMDFCCVNVADEVTGGDTDVPTLFGEVLVSDD